MSAFIVDRNHIRYLVASALWVAGKAGSIDRFSWYHHETRHELTSVNATEVGQMLWDENIVSVKYRYPEFGGPADPLPGPMNEDFVYLHKVAPVGFKPELAQVMKSIDCYSYQSCEHPDWESSSAWAFVQELRKRTSCVLPGYEEAEWGAPEIGPPPASIVDSAEADAAPGRPLNLIIRADGTWEEMLPADGQHYTLEELKSVVGGGYIEIVHLPDGRLMVLDEQGKLNKLPFNVEATDLFTLGKVVTVSDDIAGDVLVCEDWRIR